MDAKEKVVVESPVPVSAPVAPAGARKRLVEDWARDKGMLPELVEKEFPPNYKPRAKQKKPQVHNPHARHFHAARAGKNWPPGKETTEAEFDAAIAETKAHVYR